MMNNLKTLAIIGAGDLGQQIAHYALNNDYKDIVFLDDTIPPLSTNKVIGKISNAIKLYQNKLFDEIIIGIGYNHFSIREDLYNNLKNNIPFTNIIHSSVIIDNSVKLGKGNFILAGVILDQNVQLENNIVLNIGVSIAHNSIIKNNSFLGPRVAMAGFSEIGENCFIGINTTIIDNIQICNNTKIGAGTVITKSIKKAGLYVGNPHRFIK